MNTEQKELDSSNDCNRDGSSTCDYKIPVACPLLHCVTNCPRKTECVILQELRSSSCKCCNQFFKHFEEHFKEPHTPILPPCAQKANKPNISTYCPYYMHPSKFRGIPVNCPYYSLMSNYY